METSDHQKSCWKRIVADPEVVWRSSFKMPRPSILKDKKYGKESQKLFNDAKCLLDKIVTNKLLTARAIMRIIPASSVGDDIELYNLKNESIAQFHFLRQQVKKADYQFCLSDFIAPKKSGKPDWLGAFAVTTGIGLDKIVEGFEDNNDDRLNKSIPL